MNVQSLSTGKWSIEYDKVEYQSPLWVISHNDAEVVYAEGPDQPTIARVYKKDDEWYLSTAYLGHWQPIAAMSKYEGFLLLLNIYKAKREQ